MQKIQTTIRMDADLRFWAEKRAKENNMTHGQFLERMMLAGKAAIEAMGTIYPDGVLPKANEALQKCIVLGGNE